MNNNYTFAAWQAEIISQLACSHITKPITILDFGSGNGLLANFIKNAFFNAKVIAVDTDEQKIKILKSYPFDSFSPFSHSGPSSEYSEDPAHTECFAKAKCIEVEAIHIQNKLPFNDNSFDLIYAANTFHHIAKDKQDYWLQELFRVLKKDGQLIILELNPFNFKTWYQFKNNPEEKDAQLISPYAFKKRLKQFGTPTLQFHYSNQKSRIMQKVPFGPVFTIVIKK